MDARPRLREILSFAVLAIGCAWAVFWLFQGHWQATQWAMSMPALVGFALAWLFRRETPAAVGFEYTGAGPWIFAVLYPWAFEALAVGLAYAVRAATHNADFIYYSPDGVRDTLLGNLRWEAIILASILAIALAWRWRWPLWARVAIFAPMLALYHFGQLAPPGSFGEEMGWRGYLVRRLRETPVAAALISGAVWAVFHLPIVIGNPFLRGASTLCAIFAAGTLFAWLYLWAGSVWPCAGLHFTWNMWNPFFLGDPYRTGAGLFSGQAWIFNGEGVFGLVINGLIAAALIARWRRREAAVPLAAA